LPTGTPPFYFPLRRSTAPVLSQSAQPQVCLRHSANLLLRTPCLSVWDTLGHLLLHLLAFPWLGVLFAVLVLPQSAQPQGCPRHSPNLLTRAPWLSSRGTRGHLPLHQLAVQWPRVLITGLVLPFSAKPPGCPRHSPNHLLRAPWLSVWGSRGHLPLHLLAVQWPKVWVTVLVLPHSAEPQGCPQHSPNLLLRSLWLSGWGSEGHLPLQLLKVRWQRILITVLVLPHSAEPPGCPRHNPNLLLWLPGYRFGAPGAIDPFTCWQFSGRGI